MKFFRPSAPAMPTSDTALPGRSEPMDVPITTSSTAPRSPVPGPTARRPRSSPSAASGAPRRTSGRRPASSAPPSAMPAASRPNPTYDEVCTGKTGHAEVVLVAYDPTKVSYEQLLKVFWEHHDPTQGMRQGNDVGTSYRSVIYAVDDEQRAAAEASRDMYQERLTAAGYGEITTEIAPAADVLLRRGLPPAVPGQEPARLLPGPLDRRQLPDRAGVEHGGDRPAEVATPRTSDRRQAVGRLRRDAASGCGLNPTRRSST